MSHIKESKFRKSEKDANLLRRGTVVEDAAEGLIKGKEHERLEKLKKKRTFKQRIGDFLKSIYNPEYKEFLARDGKDCCQLSFFYFVFYALLSGFFILLLLAFHSTIDPVRPTYYNKTSVMNIKGVNPGLGFRPQHDPEDNLIYINLTNSQQWKHDHIETLSIFLNKYERFKNEEVHIVQGRPATYVQFDYHKIVDNTTCAKERYFGFEAGTPCIAVKVNRIFGWKPKALAQPPSNLFNVSAELNATLSASTTKYKKFLYISCEGENVVDKDNIGEIEYFSLYPSHKIGGIPINFYPYENQDFYLSPLVFVQFKNLTRNVLVNVRCKLWGENVDNEDYINQRGMVRFELFIA